MSNAGLHYNATQLGLLLSEKQGRWMNNNRSMVICRISALLSLLRKIQNE